jgi:SAM-dependent methyltransferase
VRDFFRLDWSGYDAGFYVDSGTLAGERMVTRQVSGMKPGAAVSIIALLGVASPSVFASPPVERPADLEATIRTIQNACFASYPQDLLAAMSGRPDAPPPEVRDDPARQMEYLRTEAVRERGLFYPSSLDEILPGIAAVVRPGTRFLDLGSGDGRVVFLAAVLGAEATGIEYDRRLHDVARDALDRLAATVPRARVRLRRGDFFRADWSPYDVVYYFGLGSFAEARMLEKLAREMSPGAVLLLAHMGEAPPGFASLGRHGVVHVWRREPPDPP